MRTYKLTDGYSLTLHETGIYRDNKPQVEYTLTTSRFGEWSVLFEGADFYTSPFIHDSEGPESAASLLKFLTLRPGDTDEEYFEKYTPAQMEFAQTEAERYSWEWVEHLGFDPDSF